MNQYLFYGKHKVCVLSIQTLTKICMFIWIINLCQLMWFCLKGINMRFNLIYHFISLKPYWIMNNNYGKFWSYKTKTPNICLFQETRNKIKLHNGYIIQSWKIFSTITSLSKNMTSRLEENKMNTYKKIISVVNQELSKKKSINREIH